MKLSDYLKDKYIFLICDIIAVAGIPLMLYLLSADLSLISFFLFVLLACALMPLGLDYARRNNFYRGLLSLLDSLEQKNVLAEVMERPTLHECMIWYDVLRISNKAMLEEIGKYKRLQAEYREYIEMWVHEIKTPIASSRLILDNNENEPHQGLSEDLGTLENLVEQVLFYARSNGVEKDYMLRRCDLQEIVYAAARRNARQMISRKIKLDVCVDHLDVYTDEKWVEFILNQILINAAKYCDKADSRIAITATCLPNGVLLEIADNGMGIPAADLPRVLEKGFTGSNGRKLEKSTGMGLYLCDKLCGRLGHKLSIHSAEGRGTTVGIVFPKNSMIIS